MTVFPGSAIFVTVMAFNFLGDGLRDVLDPRGQTSVTWCVARTGDAQA